MDPASSPSALAAAAYLVGSAGSVVFVSWRLARRIAKDDLPLVALIGTMLSIAQAVGVSLVLGMTGVLSRTPVLITHVALGAVVLARVRAEKPFPPRRWTMPALGALGLGTTLAAVAAAPTVRAIRTQSSDTVLYHVVNLATWLQNRNIWTLPFQNPGFYTATHPGNGELLGLWLTLPTHSDQLTYLGVLVSGLLTVLATASVARDLGGDVRIGALVGIAIVAAQTSFATQAHSLSTDLAATGGLVAGVALLLRAVRAEAIRDRMVFASLAGTGVGLSLGSKYTSLIPAFLVIIWVLVALRPWRVTWLFLPGLVLFAAPWFARNALQTGNPLFPQDIRIGGIHLLSGGTSPLDVLKTSIAQDLRARNWHVLHRWASLATHYYGFAGLLGIGGIISSVRRSSQRAARVIVAGLALGALGAYALTPYTGGGPQGVAFLMGSNQRYALTAVVLGGALAAAALPRIITGALLIASLSIDAYQIGRGAGFRTDINVSGSVFAAALILSVFGMIVAALWPRLTPAIRARSMHVPRAPTLVIGLALAWLGISGIVVHIDHAQRLNAVETAIEGARNLGGPIIVIGVTDVRSALGPRLDARIETLDAGNRGHSNPFTDQAALTRALDASGAKVLVVPATPGSVSLPQGWKPPAGWRVAGGDAGATVYIKPADEGG